jgi:hypothetical protein
VIVLGTASSAQAVAPIAVVAAKLIKDPKVIGRTLENVPIEMPNATTRTAGGHTFWNRIDESQGWKLQCNKLMGNCRILDPDDYRFGWGGEGAMRRMFDALKKNGMVFYHSSGLPDIQVTLGGKVFWDNLASQDGWRVQQNKFSGHCRVLDADDRRVAWGRCADLASIFENRLAAADVGIRVVPVVHSPASDPLVVIRVVPEVQSPASAAPVAPGGLQGPPAATVGCQFDTQCK